MAYNYEYHQFADHANADALYSLPSKGGDGTAEEEKIFYFSIMEDLSVKAKDIGHSTNKDLVLSQVRELTLNGWPSYVKEKTLKQFFTRRTELSVEQGCVLCGMRAIVSPARRLTLHRDLHRGHPRMCRMKALARSSMCWPGVNKDIEETVQKCSACQTVRQLPAAVRLHCWKWPARVCQRIDIDFCEKDKQYFLVLVDSHSNG